MKTINLCGKGKCCPVVNLMDNGNVNIKDDDTRESITLSKDQWNTLKLKIQNGEL